MSEVLEFMNEFDFTPIVILIMIIIVWYINKEDNTEKNLFVDKDPFVDNVMADIKRINAKIIRKDERDRIRALEKYYEKKRRF